MLRAGSPTSFLPASFASIGVLLPRVLPAASANFNAGGSGRRCTTHAYQTAKFGARFQHRNDRIRSPNTTSQGTEIEENVADPL
jgi:hypothetical protein